LAKRWAVADNAWGIAGIQRALVETVLWDFAGKVTVANRRARQHRKFAIFDAKHVHVFCAICAGSACLRNSDKIG